MQLADQHPGAALRHERIFQLKLGAEKESRMWLVTEEPLCPTLGEVMESKGPQSLKDSLKIFGQVTEAVSFLHGHGFSHGAIVPDTIFVDQNNRCLVGWIQVPADAAPEVPTHTQFPEWAGFIAPEVRAGAQPDSRSDVFSLGVLLHWLLTRQIPNGGGPSSKIPRQFAGVIQRAVDKNPQTRVQTVSGLMDLLHEFSDKEIERFDEELELAVHSAGFDPRLLWRRHPRTVIATCVVLLAIGLITRWQMHKYRDRQRQRQARLQEQQDRLAQGAAIQRRYGVAEEMFGKGQYRDALEEYRGIAGQGTVPELIEPSLAQVARCYGHLKDYGAEYTAWLRLLRQYPDTATTGEANERIVWIAAQTIKRYGDLVDISTEQEILVDGLPGDWEGISPIIVDPKGDNLQGGPDSDLTAFYAAVKGSTLFLRFDVAGTPHLGDQYCVAIDLNAFAYEDSSEQWDYQIGVARGIQPWIWDLRGARNYSNTKSEKLHGARFAQTECVEVAIPLSAFGTPTSAGIRVFMNYAGSSRANDACSRKVLVRWKRPPASARVPAGLDTPRRNHKAPRPEGHVKPRNRKTRTPALPKAGQIDLKPAAPKDPELELPGLKTPRTPPQAPAPSKTKAPATPKKK